MGFLSLFSKSQPVEAKIDRLPSGSFTLDRTGKVIVSTLPGSFPESIVHEIGAQVLETFASARKAKLTLAEFQVHYGGLKISAKEQRGGAMILLAPAR